MNGLIFFGCFCIFLMVVFVLLRMAYLNEVVMRETLDEPLDEFLDWEDEMYD